jgi:mono/diheme cytochrome c family protein
MYTDGRRLDRQLSSAEYEIVKQIMAGVAADKSTTGTVMPPKGGSGLTDVQVKAVAAYVWSLSHKTK